LLQSYEIAVAEIRKLDQNAKIPEIKKKDFEQMTPPELNYWLGPASRVVKDVEAQLNNLCEQQETQRKHKEAQRKAGLPENERMREYFVELRAEVAELRAENAELRASIDLLKRRMGIDLPEIPTADSFKNKPAAPMLVPSAQRGGGPITKFFGDDQADQPSGGVRRVGRNT
jgi:hypothetical protein